MASTTQADLRYTFEQYAGWIQQPLTKPSTAEQWVQRLAINEAEIQHFLQLPATKAQPFQARPVQIKDAQGTVSRAQFSLPVIPPKPEQALQRAKSLNPDLHLFTALAEMVPNGQAGYLHNLPIAVKDMTAVAGFAVTAGSASGDFEPVTQDALSVARLRTKGAVVIGMANQHEMAFGASSNNPRYGRVINPASPEHIPGGSSGGSAAIVAADVCRVTLGTDTGGSIRLPAACCGVVGFKPTYDSVPRDGSIDVAPSLDHLGPIAKYVQDCALVYAGLLDLPQEPDWAVGNLAGIRVGRLGGYFAEPLESQVLQALDQACQSLEKDKASVQDILLPEAHMAAALQFMIITSEATASYTDRLQEKSEQISEEIRIRLEIGHFLPAPWYLRAQKLRTELNARIEALFDQVDILICPTMRCPAPKVGATEVQIGHKTYPLHTAVTQLTMPFSLSGSPAISIPWGVAQDGAPIGLQLIARQGDDWRLLAVAQRLEAAGHALFGKN